MFESDAFYRRFKRPNVRKKTNNGQYDHRKVQTRRRIEDLREQRRIEEMHRL